MAGGGVPNFTFNSWFELLARVTQYFTDKNALRGDFFWRSEDDDSFAD